MSQSEEVDPVRQLVLAARRRLFVLRSVRAALWSFCAALGSLALLLLAGTSLIGWPVFNTISGIAAALAITHVIYRFPDAFDIAQDLDRRCDLNDSLSTAWHVAQRGMDTSAARFQLRYAERVASEVNIREAFPVDLRRPILWVSGLVVLVASLSMARYGHSDRLDLHPSFLALWRMPQSEPEPTLASTESHLPTPMRVPTKASGSANAADPKVPEDASQGKSPGDPQSASAPGESSTQHGVFQRMKEALSDLLDNFKPETNAGADSADRSTGPEANKNAEKQRQSDKSGSEGNQQRGANNQDNLAQTGSGSSQNGEREGNRESEAKTRPGEGGLSQSEANKADGNGNSPQSGAGTENGSQRIATATELKAMGKIEQIIGQRATQISGDMTIVTSGGPQQLSTDFSGRDAQHRIVDSPVPKDRIAPEDRDYVRRYMDEMHRITDKQEAEKHVN